jgi:quercetin dioxygenase-like cupin family protein
MKRKVVIFTLVLAIGIGVGLIVSQHINAQRPLPKTQIILTTDLTGIEGREGIIYLAHILPGEVAGKHYHPGYQFSYVLEGSIIMNMEGKSPVTYKPGDAFYVPPRQVHWPKNDGNVPVKIVSFWIKEKGEPPNIPVK